MNSLQQILSLSTNFSNYKYGIGGMGPARHYNDVTLAVQVSVITRSLGAGKVFVAMLEQADEAIYETGEAATYLSRSKKQPVHTLVTRLEKSPFTAGITDRSAGR